MPRTRIVLLLENFAESIQYKPYDTDVGDRTLLDWLTARIEHFSGDVAIVVGGDRYNAINPFIGINGLSMCEAFAECGRVAETDHVAFLTAGACLLPDVLLASLIERHRNLAADLTLVKDLPAGSSCAIYRSQVLLMLPSFADCGLPADPETLLRAVATAASAGGSESGLPLIRVNTVALGPDKGPITYLPDDTTLTGRNLAIITTLLSGLSPAAPLSADLLARWRALQIAHRAHAKAIFCRPKHRADVFAGQRTVLYVSSPSAFSGGEESLCDLIRHLDPHRYHASALVSFEGHLTSQLRNCGAKVMCPNDDFTTGSVESLAYLDEILRTTDPDIVHFNAFEPITIHLLCATRSIPMVQHVRVADPRPAAMQIGYADEIIAISRFVASRLSAVGVATDKVRVVYNGVDTTRFFPGAVATARAKKALGVPLTDVLIVMVARYTPRKRHDIMLAAFEQVIRVVKHARLLLVGGQQEFGSTGVLQQVLASSGKDRIIHLPFAPDIRGCLCAADVVVLPAEEEPLGRCILEAMALGIPVIVADSGGLVEIVSEGQTGRIVPTGDVDALKGVLIELLTDKMSGASLADSARAHIQAHFSSSGHATAVVSIYDGILERRIRPDLTSC